MAHAPSPPPPAAAPRDAALLVHLPPGRFLLACLLAAVGVAVAGRFIVIPAWVLAAEVLATVVALFVLGSSRYRLDKNALAYGAGLIAVATFLGIWWGRHARHGLPTLAELNTWGPALRQSLLTFAGLDALIHLDTMLFILGLTLFVSIVAQTRILEDATMVLLRRSGGRVLPTVLAVAAGVAVASGVFDGVSMIGLTIRTLAIVLLLARAPLRDIRHAVMVCTVVTTVCGIWLAYGEPPNLIMKANLHDAAGATLLTDGFFLRYCLPAAVLSFLCVAWDLRRRLRGLHVAVERLDVLDVYAGTVRFIQAMRQGRVPTAIEVVKEHGTRLGPHADAVLAGLQEGEVLGLAMAKRGVPPEARLHVLGALVTPELAGPLDEHYRLAAGGSPEAALAAQEQFRRVADALAHRRARVQRLALLAAVPFAGLLVWHGMNHHVPLFLASFAGFAVALAAVWRLPRLRGLALREAHHEFAEYYFLFPLFLGISLLARVGFFDQFQTWLNTAVQHTGHAATAVGQFYALGALSAMLDNNVVADFAGHALHNLPLAVLHLFALAQIAGYAVGGCLTHIGSAQSVVAYAFIRRDLDGEFAPIHWIRAMAPVLLAIAVALTALIVVESLLLGVMG